MAAPLRSRILDASVTLFATHGIAATTTRQIADAADVAAGSVYYHFASKDDLIEEILLQADLAADLQGIADDTDRSVRDRLVDIATTFLETLRDRRELLSVVVQAALVDERHRRRLAMTMRTDTEVVVGLVDRATGTTSSARASRVLASTLLRSLVTTALLHPDPTPQDAAMVTGTVDLLLRGAAPPDVQDHVPGAGTR